MIFLEAPNPHGCTSVSCRGCACGYIDLQELRHLAGSCMRCGRPEAGAGIWGEDAGGDRPDFTSASAADLHFLSGESLVKDTSCWAVGGNEGLSALLCPLDRICLLEGLDVAIFSFSFFPPLAFPSFYV